MPEQWHAETPPPRLRVLERGQAQRARHRRPGARRTEEQGRRLYRPPDEEAGALGRARRSASSSRKATRFWLSPVDKKERRELFISDLKDAEPGDLVLCEVTGRPPRVSARVDAVLGDPFAPRSFSLIAIHKHGLRHEFAQAEAIAIDSDEARRAAGPERLGSIGCAASAEDDLTHLPIVAIDPEDARDHDDAIWARARRRSGQ